MAPKSKPPFDPQIFLATVGNGRTIAEYSKDQIVFSQGDLMMPNMTGMDFYETLLGRHPDLARQVVFMSGGATTAKAGDFLRSVANLLVSKPFTSKQLLETVQRRLVAHQPASLEAL